MLRLPEWKKIDHSAVFLRRLRGAVGTALGRIESRNPLPKGPINWADLGCTEVSYCVNDSGVEYYTVTISECDPHATALEEAVRFELAKRKWIDLDKLNIILEW
jgi:hypothetical protein